MIPSCNRQIQKLNAIKPKENGYIKILNKITVKKVDFLCNKFSSINSILFSNNDPEMPWWAWFKRISLP